MRKTDYDEIASTYDRRYQTEQWGAVEDAIEDFVGADPRVVLEVGCGMLALNRHVSSLNDPPRAAVAKLARCE